MHGRCRDAVGEHDLLEGPLVRRLTCTARDWHASPYSSGLPWYTPDCIGQEPVCHPFRPTRAFARVQDAHPPLQARLSPRRTCSAQSRHSKAFSESWKSMPPADASPPGTRPPPGGRARCPAVRGGKRRHAACCEGSSETGCAGACPSSCPRPPARLPPGRTRLPCCPVLQVTPLRLGPLAAEAAKTLLCCAPSLAAAAAALNACRPHP